MPQPEKPTNHLTPRQRTRQRTGTRHDKAQHRTGTRSSQQKGAAQRFCVFPNGKARISGSASSEFQPVHNFRPGRQAATQAAANKGQANKGQALKIRTEMRDPTVLHLVDSGLSITSQANKGQALEFRAEMRDPTVLHLFDSGLSITSGCWRDVSAVCFVGAAHYRHI